ncbi:MAG: DUF5723 family protein [Cytophagaceae bacterium]|nr:DUF5723 family protein [Cytophagaceae bacterium]
MKNFVSFILFFLISSRAVAQYLLGIGSSNYAGTNGLYLNPAHVADSRHKVFVNLATYDNFLTNNYLAWGAPYSVNGMFTNTVPDRYRSDRGLILFRDEYLIEKLNGRDKRITLGADLRGPSVLYTINDRFGVALTSRLRLGGTLTHVSESVARLIRYGTAETTRIEPEDFGTGFALNLNGYAEFGGTFGAVLVNSDVDFIKAGVTLKRLVGLYSAHMIADNLAYKFVSDPTTRGKANVLIENVDVRYGHTDEDAFLNAAPTPQFLLGRQSAGGGWGVDLGIVYEYRPDIGKYDYREKGVRRFDPGQNKYQFRLSVSLLDVGAVRYRNPAYVSAYDVSRTNRLIDDNAFDKIGGSDDFLAAVNTTLGVTDSDRQTSFRSALPTALQVSLDYKVQENMYVNALLMQRLGSTRTIGMTAPNVLAITPRYERKWLEASLPVVFFDDYRAMTIGLALRAGPIFIGTDHLSGFLNIGNPKGYDAYFGAHIPIFRRRPAGPDACWYEKKEKRGLRKLMFWKKV